MELVCELIQDIFLSPPPLACKIKTIDYLWANCYVTMARRTILTALTVLIMSLCSVLKGRADTNPLIQFSREEYSKYHYALSVPFLLVNQEEIAQEGGNAGPVHEEIGAEGQPETFAEAAAA